ncbi:MAG: rhomboid family intramembrane serine protease [Acidimicrobiia bacterium]
MTFLGLAVLGFVLSGFGRAGGNAVFEAFAQANWLVEAGEWWRIFTPVLLHASITHLLFNGWALWVLGPQIERGVGTWPFVSLYIAAAGVGGAFAYYLGDIGDVAVGASGAIFGLFGIWLDWALHRRDTVHGRMLLRQIGFLLLLNAAIPFFVRTISWQAHLGGFLAGLVIGEIWSRVRGRNAVAWRTVVGFAVALLSIVAVLV